MANEAGEDGTSARLALPLLRAGQAQKEMWHNEALAALDMAVQASVVAVGADVPPSAPRPGECWVVGASPVGDWAGRAGAIAGWTAGGWRFLVPSAGWSVWSGADAQVARYVDGGWRLGEVSGRQLLIGGVKVVGPRAGSIGDPAGGSLVDVEVRAAVVAILQALRIHGLIAT